MRWLSRLLSHAAAAGRIPATSHGFASGGRGSRRGVPGMGAAGETVVRSEEPMKRPDAAAKRSRRPAAAEAVVPSDELKRQPDAAKWSSTPAVEEAVVRSEEPKKRRRDAAAAKKPMRQRAVSSTSCQHGELDLARVQAKLKPLLSRANLIITRRVEWANIMLGFQQETRYIIKDPRTPRRKTPVGLIREKSNVILRQLLRSRRPFIAEFTDHKGNEIFTVRRPFRWINSSIYAEVDGKEIGVVHSRWHLWRRIYDLYLGNMRFAVVENPGFWSSTFTLLDGNENLVAKIERKARGIGLELFRDAGQYAILFGDVGTSWRFSGLEDMGKLHTFLPLALPERAVALALAVSIDRDYFSRRLGWGNNIFGGGSRWRHGAARPTSSTGRRSARKEDGAARKEDGVATRKEDGAATEEVASYFDEDDLEDDDGFFDGS